MAVINGHDRYVFVADEVIFQVVHPDTTAGIFDAISGFLNEEPQDNQQPEDRPYWRKSLIPPNGDLSRIVTFSSPTQLADSERFSLIAVKLNNRADGNLTQDDVIILLNDAYTELGGLFPIVLTKGEEERQDIILRSISPNWLASDLHHGANTGGPGSMPGKKNPSGNDHKFKLRGRVQDPVPPLFSLLQHKLPESESGVQVAILDTAISLDDGVIINTGTELPPESVVFPPEIKDMLTGKTNHCPEDATMKVVFYKDVVPHPFKDDLNLFDPYATWPHHYEMPDHGTFIASIIRAIAPCVKIYLYEVLNRFGVGSLVSIAAGVLNAVNDTPLPLVINCSFTLDHDLEALVLEGDASQALKELLPPESEQMEPEQKEKRQRNQGLLELSMRDVFKWATELTPMELNPNVRVVAAAGNDGKDGNRPPPRYPAAFKNVLSAAALPKKNPRHDPSTPDRKKFRTSSFSNLAHSDSNKEAYSFATYGGELTNGTSKPKNGVLGVYIGGIPTQNPNGTFNAGHGNPTGWAEWSGTSFAAPIISALLAVKDSDLQLDNIAAPVLSDPLDPSRPFLTVEKENVILVNQG